MIVRLFVAMAALLIVSAPLASATDGAAIYKAQCAKCHGETGQADTPIGKALKAPALAGDMNIQKMSAEDVVAGIKSNAKHPPAIKSLGDDDLKAVAGFVKGLAGK